MEPSLGWVPDDWLDDAIIRFTSPSFRFDRKVFSRKRGGLQNQRTFIDDCSFFYHGAVAQNMEEEFLRSMFSACFARWFLSGVFHSPEHMRAVSIQIMEKIYHDLLWAARSRQGISLGRCMPWTDLMFHHGDHLWECNLRPLRLQWLQRVKTRLTRRVVSSTKIAKRSTDRETLDSTFLVQKCGTLTLDTRLLKRLKAMLLLESRKVMVNPARADVTQVKVLDRGFVSYFTIPFELAPPRQDGNPRTACFFLSGIVAKSMLRQPATKPEGSLLGYSDHRIALWGFNHEFQRALAYLGAVGGYKNLVYESFLGECLIFRTLPEGASRTISSAFSENESKPYFQGELDESDNNAQHFASYDFPNGLKYETKVPVYDATDPNLGVSDNVWEDIKKLPLHLGEVPGEAVVTVAYTAELVFVPFAIPPCRKVDLYIQFVVIHKM
ncbi:hypothetical protein DFP72DRAFT_1081511 [Ephemerocybe angulata]|uniref:Uncharacterized protein n=1 Tax=Ephemerocybe angulata TaxID=980116 RepID=A0A8H6LU37_9AGAR|nr:hypothetical protein DFP72DRAFT_1081511 [Tulosesus angulatus]